MGFGSAIAAFYKRSFDFQGRSMRSEFWWSQLYLVVMGVGVFWTLIMLVESGTMNDEFFTIAVLFLFFFVLFSIIPSISQTVRRFHDQDQSGWLFFIHLLPFGGIIILFFMAHPGTEGPNIYGDDPKGGIDPLTF